MFAAMTSFIGRFLLSSHGQPELSFGAPAQADTCGGTVDSADALDVMPDGDAHFAD